MCVATSAQCSFPSTKSQSPELNDPVAIMNACRRQSWGPAPQESVFLTCWHGVWTSSRKMSHNQIYRTLDLLDVRICRSKIKLTIGFLDGRHYKQYSWTSIRKFCTDSSYCAPTHTYIRIAFTQCLHADQHDVSADSHRTRKLLVCWIVMENPIKTHHMNATEWSLDAVIGIRLPLIQGHANTLACRAVWLSPASDFELE